MLSSKMTTNLNNNKISYPETVTEERSHKYRVKREYPLNQNYLNNNLQIHIDIIQM